MSKSRFKANFEPWKSSQTNNGMPIVNHGFVQHSFNRNPADLNPNGSLFFADCV
jgi:hypothetical protein